MVSAPWETFHFAMASFTHFETGCSPWRIGAAHLFRSPCQVPGTGYPSRSNLHGQHSTRVLPIILNEFTRSFALPPSPGPCRCSTGTTAPHHAQKVENRVAPAGSLMDSAAECPAPRRVAVLDMRLAAELGHTLQVAVVGRGSLLASYQEGVWAIPPDTFSMKFGFAQGSEFVVEWEIGVLRRPFGEVLIGALFVDAA